MATGLLIIQAEQMNGLTNEDLIMNISLDRQKHGICLKLECSVCMVCMSIFWTCLHVCAKTLWMSYSSHSCLTDHLYEHLLVL